MKINVMEKTLEKSSKGEIIEIPVKTKILGALTNYVALYLIKNGF